MKRGQLEKSSWDISVWISMDIWWAWGHIPLINVWKNEFMQADVWADSWGPTCRRSTSSLLTLTPQLHQLFGCYTKWSVRMSLIMSITLWAWNWNCTVLRSRKNTSLLPSSWSLLQHHGEKFYKIDCTTLSAVQCTISLEAQTDMNVDGKATLLFHCTLTIEPLLKQ